MDDRLIRIIDSLKVGTEGRKLQWQSTARKNEFIINLGHGSITVDSWEYQDGPQDDDMADVAFLNKQGEVLERIVFSGSAEYEDYKEIMALHTLARRNSLRIDETLDGMLQEIQQKINN